MKAYHYTECGLDNIYLVNGVKITKTKSGDEEIFIHDIHGLHKAIGMILVSKRGFLSGKEIKFIRSTLDLSQTTLAKILGCSYQTVLLWEKDKGIISKTADHLLRAIFFSYLDVESGRAIYDKINEISDLDADTVEIKNAGKIELEEVSDVWRMVA
jgi:DNA-binding transcriptional regulator YiaG